ncbi:ArgS-related anticodon-binding protein NrtL [Streptomyces sp. NPDC057638]|uniref:ArgS-related anticodon-binding protein NrtL n=1 Tax=Streptomyces sp. NPDC057638 TaxID=3346190 RepID=UPI00368F04C5
MTPTELSRTVAHAVRRAVADGVLSAPVPESVVVARPRPGGCGDYATNVALRLAGVAGQPARGVAEILRERIADLPGVADVEITGPGFLNITLEKGTRQALVRRVLEQGTDYGQPGGAQRVPAGHESRERLWAQAVAALRRGQGRDRGDADVPRPVPYRSAGAGDLTTDAHHWGLLSAAAHDRPRMGPWLLRQHESNPLFTVRYAHSRAHALTRGAARLGFTGQAPAEGDGTSDGMSVLIGLIEDYPPTLADAARLGAPDRVARHLERVAEALLAFQHTVLPVGDEKPSAAHRSRLALAEAAGTVLAGGLSLLGVSAPVHL